jgi:hypothetical protein
MRFLHISSEGNKDQSVGQITDAAVSIAKALKAAGVDCDVDVAAGADCWAVYMYWGRGAFDKTFDFEEETNQKYNNN